MKVRGDILKKYMIIGFTDIDLHDSDVEPTSEHRQEIYKQWGAWQKEMGDLLVTIGSPLQNGKSIDSSGEKGDATSNISGYMIIKANDLEHAVALLNKSPLFGMGHGQKYEIFESIM
jgi:hypothetical protein